MRSYSGLLVFESVFDSIPSQDTELVAFANSLFSPTVQVVEQDCQTMLGRKIVLETYVEGNTRTDTGTILSRGFIDTLLATGTYQTYTRTLDTCVSQGGVCLKCYCASKPYLPIPSVGSFVKIDPEYVAYEENVESSTRDSQIVVYPTQDMTTFDYTAVYNLGALVTPLSVVGGSSDIASGYVVVPDNSGMVEGTPPYMDYYTLRGWVADRTPFMYWLAGTYSGSLLGMSQLSKPPLPLRPALIESLISISAYEELYEYVRSTNRAPGDMIEYVSSIPNFLEKSLFTLALGIIYSPFN